jgi:hypothetical protein
VTYFQKTSIRIEPVEGQVAMTEIKMADFWKYHRSFY